MLADRCYGCGRCLPICPLGLIEEREQHLPAAVDAVLEVAPPSNPVPVTRPVLEQLLRRALEGSEPS